MLNTYNKILLFEIFPTLDNYFASGNIILTNESNFITLNNIKIYDEILEGYAFEYTLYVDENYLLIKNGNISLYEYDDNSKLIKLNNFIEGISIYLKDDINKEKFLLLNEYENKKLKLVINYLDKNLDEKNYILYFDLNKTYSNSKIFYGKYKI